MAAATSPDPISLSAPEKAFRLQDVEDSISSSERPDSSYTQGFSVVIPRMDPEAKLQYTDFKLNVRKIVATHTERSKMYYYALLGDGKYHKIKEEALRHAYPDLVELYNQQKSSGTLPPFDSSGQAVHPYSRIDMTSKSKRGAAFLPTNTSEDIVEDSEGSYRSQSDMDGGISSEYDDDEAPVKSRRSKRLASRSTEKSLPGIRPLRTRSIVPDSEYETDSAVAQPTRRPTRRKTHTKATRMAEASADELANDSEDFADLSAKSDVPKMAKKKNRGRASRPAYGNFRVVADLDFDACSDEESVRLRTHRGVCEKCGQPPTHVLLQRQSKKQQSKNKRKVEEREDHMTDDDKLTSLGGWVRCLKCPIVMHWKCLSLGQRNEILKAAFDRDAVEYRKSEATKGDVTTGREPVRRLRLEAYQTTEFICNYCLKGGHCIGCKEVVLEPDPSTAVVISKLDKDDISMTDVVAALLQDTNASGSRELLYRCITCKRLAHYAHLPKPSDMEEDITVGAIDLAKYYQVDNDWTCFDCSSYVYRVDKILAWRPSPPDAIEPENSNYKDMLPREYLIKWQDRSYRRTQWVPHMWLLSTHLGKLSNFVQGKSPNVELLKYPINEDEDVTEATDDDGREESDPPLAFGDVIKESSGSTPVPDEASPSRNNPDAERKIPLAWKTVDRILDILMYTPRLKGEEPDQDAESERAAVFEHGKQPSKHFSTSLANWERKMGRAVSEEDVDQVIWIFSKWKGLGYEESSWDSPPRIEEQGFASFVSAFNRFLASRKVHVNKLSKTQAKAFDNRQKGEFQNKYLIRGKTPALGQSDKLKLMDFQITGVNWLCNNWWTHQSSILADEMGLGKTIQIIVFIGTIITKFQASPCLIVVPHSTITNWVREFERWAPQLRVVPYYGDAKGREIIRKYEMWHDMAKAHTTRAKYHVLITTYDTLVNQKDFGLVFSCTPRWEVLVVDEGQRLKNDRSLIFKKLNELNTIHRIILTGTPLNNNIRELFNLMNFLDPREWDGLKELEKEHEVLTEELVKSLHERLRPYFLRRIKSEVLQLPPKNEVIVPVTMTPLQKELYRSILSQNLDIFKSLAQPAGNSTNRNLKKTNMQNMLMQLRKCLQHPYLISNDIEPEGLSPAEAHEKLIDASAKLRLLKIMLPKLKARGHRVLLFSQFKLVLDIVEDFLDGEGFKLLRLDGDTTSIDRQKGIDEYNRPGSDVFIYLLTTRAGGVGINLYTSDTVIIFDPDFNPHQDLQAIARAHRYGQQKPCMVFKLMVKSSAEDRIMQIGKKKLALDHVIVQKMDEDGSDDVQSILTFGAQELFQEGESDRDIVYTDADVDSLIEKTESGDDHLEEQKSSTVFSFAKVWATDKDGLEEMEVATPDDIEQGDSWAQILQRIASERVKVQAMEVTGRGAKRKAAAVIPQQQLEGINDSPPKFKSKSKKVKGRPVNADDSDAYNDKSSVHDSDYTNATNSMEADDLVHPVNTGGPSMSSAGAPQIPGPSEAFKFAIIGPAKPPEIYNASNTSNLKSDFCGLCTLAHRPGECRMILNSQNLADYRWFLITNAAGEPLETRRAAVQTIDETLQERGQLSLIQNHPSYLVMTSRRKRRKSSKTKRDIVDDGEPKQRAPSDADPGPSKLDGGATKTSKSDKSAMKNSKRDAAPAQNERPPKKLKKSADPPICRACGQSPHDIHQCPIVLDGPPSIMATMNRLKAGESHPDIDDTLAALAKVLQQQSRRRLLY